MNCKKCGTQNPDGSTFCSNCGEIFVNQNYQENARQSGSYYNAAAGGNAAPGNNAAYQYAPYTQNPPPAAVQVNQALAPVVSLGTYLLWLIVPMIPVIGLILSIVFAVDSSERNRANYFRALLILRAIGILFMVIIVIIVFTIVGFSFDAIVYGAQEFFSYL